MYWNSGIRAAYFEISLKCWYDPNLGFKIQISLLGIAKSDHDWKLESSIGMRVQWVTDIENTIQLFLIRPRSEQLIYLSYEPHGLGWKNLLKRLNMVYMGRLLRKSNQTFDSTTESQIWLPKTTLHPFKQQTLTRMGKSNEVIKTGVLCGTDFEDTIKFLIRY